MGCVVEMRKEAVAKRGRRNGFFAEVGLSSLRPMAQVVDQCRIDERGREKEEETDRKRPEQKCKQAASAQ